MSLQITDDDIDGVERLLLPPNARFCEERRRFIRSLDSLDVQACPGSGKTTALLAKLLILSSKLPLPNNAGICILTHTNAAIDEVKTRFRKEANRILLYPNYVGTIQSFVNKYLAIPAFANKYGKRPIAIDNEQFNYEVVRPQGINIRGALHYFERRRLEISSLRFSFDDFVVSRSLNDERPFVGQDNPTYKAIEKHKLKVLEKGYLCFDDAYTLANQYIRQYPHICDLISLRFKYVFIDEMQDTDVHQSRILDAIFHPDRTVIQRIGDQNQAIYTYDVKAELIWKPRNLLYISGSKRLSQPIATAIRNIGLQQQDLYGVPNRPEIKPILLFFDDSDIRKVIPFFCELIVKYDLQTVIGKPVFKVVGWAGKEHERKHRIYSYWPPYASMRKRKGVVRKCLGDFISVAPQNENCVDSYSKSIIEGITRFLRVNGVTRPDGRFFTPITFLDYLEENQLSLLNDLKLNLTRWVLQMRQRIDVFSEVKDFLTCQLAQDSKCGFPLDTSQTQAFFEKSGDSSGCVAVTSTVVLPGNIPITVDTVHGVKGETHTATLYLETFNNGYDVNKILHCFHPYAQRGKFNITQKQALKVAYVAMSRPTHLLCVAVHKNTSDVGKKQISHDLDKCRAGLEEYWQVIDLSQCT